MDLPDPGTEPRSPALQVGSLPSEPPEKPNPNLSLPVIHATAPNALAALAAFPSWDRNI